MTARAHDYLWLLVDASAWALFSALVTDICVKFKQGAGVVLGSILLWFCAGRRVLLGEVAVKSGISIYPGPHELQWTQWRR
jgi:hypothetical protein